MVGTSINTVGSTGFLGSPSSLFFVFFSFLHLSFPSISVDANSVSRALTPPRGWNSYDSFCWIISEEDFLKSADIVSQKLLPHGYEYVVVDYLWYRKNVKGASTTAYGFDVFDPWGRPQPDPARWPSSKDGTGFTKVAKQVHDKKLKFGIHIMAGMSKEVFEANTLILDPVKGGPYVENGLQWRAQDIGLKDKPCGWMKKGFISVNVKLGAGKAFLKSLHLQYAEWGVDFIKHDCVFGDDLNLDEITYVSEVIRDLNRTVVYSLSPGKSATPALAKQVSQLVNMYRVIGDDWDSWKDGASHFDIASDMAAAQMFGTKGLSGQSWPDLDMLPFGWLTDPDSNRGPYRNSRLTRDEQRTQMTLWSIAKSPLMFGGDVRKIDLDLLNLITNPKLLEINTHAYDSKEFNFATTIMTGSDVNLNPGSKQKNRLNERDMITKLAFGLTSCKEPKASSWSMASFDENHGQICWNQTYSSRPEKPFCLYNKKSLITPDEVGVQNRRYKGNLLAVTSDRAESCLGASPNQNLTSKDYERGETSSCTGHANQMWELHSDGKLENSYSGLCAVVNEVTEAVRSNGIRAWTARGKSGEVYLAIFNLNNRIRTVSVKISDLSRATSDKNVTAASCKSVELFSGKSFGPNVETVSIEIAPHAPAVFTFICAHH